MQVGEQAGAIGGGGPPPWRIGAPGLVVLLVAVLLYLPGLRNGYTGWDDTLYVTNNPHMTAPDGLARIWTTAESDQYYPLTFTSYWLEYRVWGADPMGFHATNAVLHGINSVLVLALLRVLGLSRIAAVGGALLFAVHPMQVMSVAWIAERKNLLSALWSLLGMLAWVRSFRRGSRLGYGAAVVCFALAMLSKTAVIGLPLSLIVLHRTVLGAGWRAAIVRSLPLLAVSGASVLVTILFERKFVDALSASMIPPLAERLQIAGAAPWVYIARLLLPVGLSPAYPLWHVSASSLVWWLPLAATLAAAAAVALRYRRMDGRIVWGLAHFMAMLAPTLGVIAFANLAVSPVSDHFVYVASIGIFAIAAVGIDRLLARLPDAWPRLAKAAGFVVLAVMALASLRLIGVYEDTRTFWSRVVQHSPDNYFANSGLAALHLSRGEGDQAVAYARRAVAAAPAWIDAQVVLAQSQMLAGDLPGAEQTLKQLAATAPDNGTVLSSYGSLLLRTGRQAEALAMLERAARVDAGNVDARMALGNLYFGLRRYKDAEAQFAAVVQAQPAHARAQLGLVTCQYAEGRHAEAVASARAALRALPGDINLLERLALLLATSSDDSVRRGPEAVSIMEPICAASASANPYLLNTLAAAYAEAGRFDRAVEVSLQAADAAAHTGDQRLEAECRARAEIFRSGKPLRM